LRASGNEAVYAVRWTRTSGEDHQLSERRGSSAPVGDRTRSSDRV